MIFWIALLFALYLIWLLLVKGIIWKALLFFGGWVGIYCVLMAKFPVTAHTAIIIADSNFSWATVVPTVICILALAHTRTQ
jgi:hypothetical protein